MVATDTMEKTKGEKVATLDDAMLLSGFGVYNVLHMLLCGFILMGMITQCLALGYVLPAAQCDLQLTLHQRGWITAIPFVAIILTSYFWGWMADTRGRKPVMLCAMLGSTVFSAFASFAPSVPWFAALQFISALFMSGSSAVLYTYLGEFHNLRHRDKMVAFGSSFVGIGTVILPCIAWLILPQDFAYYIPFLDIHYRPWRLFVIACAIPFTICTVLLWFAPESPKFLYANGSTEEALEVVKQIYSANMRKEKETFPIRFWPCYFLMLALATPFMMEWGGDSKVTALYVENSTAKTSNTKGAAAVLASMKEQTFPLFKLPLLPWTCLTCFVQFGILAATNGFYVWFPTILNSLASNNGEETKICDVLDANRRAAANSTDEACDDTIHTSTFERSIYIGLVFCSMYIIVGILVDYIGKRIILIVTLICTGLAAIGAHLAYNQQLAVILFAIFQMSGACIGLMNAVAVEIFPTKLRAMAICLSMMMGRVGSMAGTNLIALFLDINCGASFYLFGSLIIVNGLFCLTLPKNKVTESPKPATVETNQNVSDEAV